MKEELDWDLDIMVTGADVLRVREGERESM
jgi:hypothetical protein